MAHFGAGVEHALHYLFRLNHAGSTNRPSARDVADFYGLPPSVAAKLFTRLEKAGIVRASEGREGGFCLARDLAEITVLEVVDAIEGRKPLFQCRDIRANCALFNGNPPDWATTGTCAIHKVMIDAELNMRRSLASVTLDDIAEKAGETIPPDFRCAGAQWFDDRQKRRRDRKQEP